MANFSPAKGGAESLLRLVHDEFQPGLKYCFLENKFTAHVQARFLAGLKVHFYYMIFFEIFQPVYPGCLPGLNLSPCNP